MDTIKRILAFAALAAILVFIVSILVVIFVGFNPKTSVWIYGNLAVFLILGLSAVVINFLQEKANKDKQERQEKQAQ